MKTWEAMKYLEEGKKVRRENWSKDRYIFIDEEGYMIDEKGAGYEIVGCSDGWEIYDDRKEVEDEDLKDICNEIKKYTSKNNYNEQDGVLRMLKNYLYDISHMIERVNKEYKLDE